MTVYVRTHPVSMSSEMASGPPSSQDVDNKAVTEKFSISKNGSHSWLKGPERNFTGTVRVAPLLTQSPSPVRTTVGQVNFEPGVRSDRHTQPLGQTLEMTSGLKLETVKKQAGIDRDACLIRPDTAKLQPRERTLLTRYDD